MIIGKPSSGWLSNGAWRVRCSLGASGLTHRKREGDKATPLGTFAIRDWRILPIRPVFSRGSVKTVTIKRTDGWCDDPSLPPYNQQIRLPFKGSCEALWRDDGKYDVVGILDYNIRPCKKGAGSAIFFHICGPEFEATAGCVAITANEFRKLLPRLSKRLRLAIV